MQKKILFLLPIIIVILLASELRYYQRRNHIANQPDIKEIMNTIMNQEEYFSLTENHIRMIHEMVVIWDTSESGAPIINFYGPTEPYKKLANIIGIEIAQEDFQEGNPKIEQLKKELGNAFEVFLKFAELAPGTYSYTNPLIDLHFKDTAWRINSDSEKTMAIPLEKEISFNFSESHRKLLKNANAKWLDYWQLPGINSKRPYGDRTLFQADMADILGIPYSFDENEILQLSKKQIAELNKLHIEMWLALQTFLKRAYIEPGKYYRKPAGFGVWQKIKSR